MADQRRKDKYPTATVLRDMLETTGTPYFAKDSVLGAIRAMAKEDEKKEGKVRGALLAEIEMAFEDVLYTMLIDTSRDPNSKDTARRLAKMYMTELMQGRYTQPPAVTSFPNEKQNGNEESESKPEASGIYHFNNLLVAQCPFTSVCSHHWQPVNGVAYVGVIPGDRVIGLSKYTRIVQHLAARGTLQEELTVEIADSVCHATHSHDVGVVVFARHGCCENRGIRVHNSNTSTAEMRGLFMEKGKLREEFYDNIKMMRREWHD